MSNRSLSIGVYIPSKNRLELLKKAIDSILSQTYQNFKICIVDDGSTDGTSDYLEGLNHPKITYIRNEQSIGACASRNKAIESLDTDLVTGLDDDDVFLPSRLEDLLKVYDDKYAFVCSGYFWDYGAHKKSLFAKSKVISLSNALDLNQCSNQILVKRERVLAVKGFDANLPALQDHDLWVRLIAKFGDAYRLGKELYIVNDDRELERISSRENKLVGIELFMKKHQPIMSERNKENLLFYKKKVSGEKVSFSEVLYSSRFGMPGLKLRHLASLSLEKFSSFRLSFLQEGRFDHKGLDLFASKVSPLLATGGPGAVRATLLALCVFLFGVEENSSFSKDIFIVLLLNVVTAQTWGFYFYKSEFRHNFIAVLNRSFVFALVYPILLYLLQLVGAVGSYWLSLSLAILFHIYMICRLKLLSEKSFIFLTFIEISCFLLMLIVVFMQQYLPIETFKQSSYVSYICVLLFGSSLMFYVCVKRSGYDNRLAPSYSGAFNLSVSNLSGPFATFSIPAVVSLFASSSVVTILALAISFCSLSFLVPRVYVNKILPDLASKSSSGIINCENKFVRIVLICTVISALLCTLYISLLSGVSLTFSFFYSALTCFMMFASQLGQIYINKINLAGMEDKVLKIHAFTISICALLILSLLLVHSYFNFDDSLLTAGLFCAFSLVFYIRGELAKRLFIKVIVHSKKIEEVVSK